MRCTSLRRFIAIFACVLFSSAPKAQDSTCSIVYGADWAFLFEAPKHWQVGCPIGDPSGMAVALWPEGTTWGDAPAVMYATVSDSHGLTLTEYASDELARFGKDSPNLRVESARSLAFANGKEVLVRALSGDSNDSHEQIGYGDLGATYLIVVLSSRTQATLDQLHPAFNALISSIQPMQLKRDDLHRGADPATSAASQSLP
jgi:hypothetical protein